MSKFVLTAVPLVFLLGCGSGSAQIYTLSSGTYDVSGISAAPPDTCNYGPDFTTILQIAASGNLVTFGFGQTPDPTQAIVAAIQGNTIRAGTVTFDYDNGPLIDCVETITGTLSGRLVFNDQLQAMLEVISVRKSGAGCAPSNLGYKAFPCSSTVSFTAKKR